MELRHLRYFVTVAEFLHFGRAAQQLRIAQPSLSHQIRQLESELQTTLFERSTKRVRLTQTGISFLAEARQILEHVDLAALMVRTGRDRSSDRLRVGFGYWTDVTKVCAAVKRFNDSHGAAYIDLYCMSVLHQTAALREGRLDVGFVRPPVTDPMLSSEFLLSEPLVVAVPKKHPFARKKNLPLTALKNEPLIMASRERIPFFYDVTLRVFQEAGFIPNVHYEVDYPTMVFGLVRSGVGISLVPYSSRRVQSADVVFVSLQPSDPILETAIAWRRTDTPPLLLRDFIRITREVVSSRGDENAPEKSAA
jgi:DNA-binding transcriptional LysR family regulator